MQLGNDVPSRLARLVFTGVMTFAWTGWASTAQAQPAAAAPASAEQAAERLDRTLKLIEAGRAKVARDSFEPAALATKLGNQPAAAFDWVRTNTTWIAYKGTLRGPVGVLADRVGNSLDRSLLLADLLMRGGHTVRLAHGTIGEAEARQLIAAIPEPRELADVPPAADDIAPLAREAGLSPESLKLDGERAALAAAGRAEQAVQRTAAQVPLLTAALPPDAANNDSIASIAAMQDHWWVQIRQADNTWQDADVAGTDGRLGGKPLAAAKETVAVTRPAGSPVAVAAIDPALQHELRVRVVVEQLVGSKVTEQKVVEQPIRPADVFGLPIRLRHATPGGEKAGEALTQSKTKAELTEALRKFVLAQQEFVPTISIGGQTFYEGSFSPTGDVKAKVDQSGLTGLGKKAVQRAADLLDNDLNLPAAKPVGELTAAWIDYAIVTPGETDRTIRRDLFDVLGPAARAALAKGVAAPAITDAHRFQRGLALLGEVDILPVGWDFSNAAVEDHVAASLLANRDALVTLARDVNKATPAQAAAAAEKLSRLPGPVYGLALARRTWSRHRHLTCISRVNVLTYRNHLRQGAAGQLLRREGFDIVANEVALRPGATMSARAVRLEQGVLDTNAEAVLMHDAVRLGNAADALALSSAQKVNWRVVRRADDPALSQSALPADVKARIAADVTAGNVALVPDAPVKHDGREIVAWYRVDPVTGTSLGIGDNGWGTSTVEYSVLAFMWTMVAGTSCMAAAAADKRGLTGGDAVICILLALGAGIAMVAAVASGGGLLGLMLAGAGGAVGGFGGGLGMNTSIDH